jgi:hypothetical protein
VESSWSVPKVGETAFAINACCPSARTEVLARPISMAIRDMVYRSPRCRKDEESGRGCRSFKRPRQGPAQATDRRRSSGSAATDVEHPLEQVCPVHLLTCLKPAVRKRLLVADSCRLTTSRSTGAMGRFRIVDSRKARASVSAGHIPVTAVRTDRACRRAVRKTCDQHGRCIRAPPSMQKFVMPTPAGGGAAEVDLEETA